MFNRNFMGLLLLLVAGYAQAQLSQTGEDKASLTIEEVALKRLELERAKDDAELQKLRSGNMGMPPPQVTGQASLPFPGGEVAKPEEADPVLVAVYGLGNELRGEVFWKGVVVTVSKAYKSVGPWKLASIDQGSITLVRGQQKKVLYIAARGNTGAAAPALPMPGAR